MVLPSRANRRGVRMTVRGVSSSPCEARFFDPTRPRQAQYRALTAHLISFTVSYCALTNHYCMLWASLRSPYIWLCASLGLYMANRSGQRFFLGRLPDDAEPEGFFLVGAGAS